VTSDADFHALLALSGATGPSVVRIRIEGQPAEGLATLLDYAPGSLGAADDVLKSLDYFVFHTVLIGLKTECYLAAESFLNSLRSVWLKLPLPDRINRNRDDKRMARNRLHACYISLRIDGNHQGNGSADEKHIRAAWSVNRF
jgi:hypothetical protein